MIRAILFHMYLEFKHVQKTYDQKTLVVRDFNLGVDKGEFVTLLGPSGSGKTTILMMLAGFEHSSSGQILLQGQPIQKTPPYARNIGVVFQNYALFPHLNVAQNLAYPLRLRGLARQEIKQRVQEFLALVELQNYGNRRPNELSGGQRQRVALARALIFSPSLVLMDEPLGALDKNLRAQMQFEITRLHQRLGFTVIYVTHDQNEALTMSDRIAVFNDGVVQQYDTPAQLYERPANAFVASFIGENNLLPITNVQPLSTHSIRAHSLCQRPVIATNGDYYSLVADKQGADSEQRDPIARKQSADSKQHDPIAHKQGADNEQRSAAAVAHNNNNLPADANKVASALLSVRPEKIQINPQSPTDNLLSARLITQQYGGDFMRYFFALADGSQIIVKSLKQLPVQQSDTEKVYQLGWNQADCFAFKKTTCN